MDNKAFGKQLKFIRQKKGVTIEQLAEILDISDKAVWNIESGNRSTTLDNLVKICNALEVSPEYLLSKELDATIERPHSDYEKLYQMILEFSPGELNQFYDFAELIIKNRNRYK